MQFGSRHSYLSEPDTQNGSAIATTLLIDALKALQELNCRVRNCHSICLFNYQKNSAYLKLSGMIKIPDSCLTVQIWVLQETLCAPNLKKCYTVVTSSTALKYTQHQVLLSKQSGRTISAALQLKNFLAEILGIPSSQGATENGNINLKIHEHNQ